MSGITQAQLDAIPPMTMKEARKYCLKLEEDRIRKRRASKNGMLNFSFGSLDAFAAQFDDPGKLAAYSDKGAGAHNFFYQLAFKERRKMVDEALSSLDEDDRNFAKAVLANAGWREMGLSKATFYRKLKKICLAVRHPPSNTSL